MVLLWFYEKWEDPRKFFWIPSLCDSDAGPFCSINVVNRFSAVRNRMISLIALVEHSNGKKTH